jgi:hypothetical protein
MDVQIRIRIPQCTNMNILFISENDNYNFFICETVDRILCNEKVPLDTLFLK